MPKPKKHNGPPAKKSRKMQAFSKLSTSGPARGPGDNKNTKGSSNNMAVSGGKKAQAKQQQQQQQRRKPIIPFGRRDRVLLVGEGMYIIYFLMPLSYHLYYIILF